MKVEVDWKAIKKEKQMKKCAEKDKRRKKLVESMSPEELAEYDRVHMEFR